MLRPLELLISLYPSAYRAEFGTEMMDVLDQKFEEARSQGILAQLKMGFKESAGLVQGGVAEHIRCRLGEKWFPVADWRIVMRNGFRYPRVVAPMMLLIFAAIMLVIYKARAVQIQTDYAPDPVLLIGLALLVAGAAGAVCWLVLHGLRRSGVHRLAEVQTWPQAK